MLFLGGTINNNWREKLIQLLKNENIEYYNPVVKNYNEEAKRSVNEDMKKCDSFLFVITKEQIGLETFNEILECQFLFSDKPILIELIGENYDFEKFIELISKHYFGRNIAFSKQEALNIDDLISNLKKYI